MCNVRMSVTCASFNSYRTTLCRRRRRKLDDAHAHGVDDHPVRVAGGCRVSGAAADQLTDFVDGGWSGLVPLTVDEMTPSV